MSTCSDTDKVKHHTIPGLKTHSYLRDHMKTTSLKWCLSHLGPGSKSDPNTVLSDPEVQVRLESGPGAAVHSPLAEQNGFLQCRVQAFCADFIMTSLRNLAFFLEDDSASQVLPMEITIKDTHVNLKVVLHKMLLPIFRALQIIHLLLFEL